VNRKIAFRNTASCTTTAAVIGNIVAYEMSHDLTSLDFGLYLIIGASRKRI